MKKLSLIFVLLPVMLLFCGKLYAAGCSNSSVEYKTITLSVSGLSSNVLSDLSIQRSGTYKGPTLCTYSITSFSSTSGNDTIAKVFKSGPYKVDTGGKLWPGTWNETYKINNTTIFTLEFSNKSNYSKKDNYVTTTPTVTIISSGAMVTIDNNQYSVDASLDKDNVRLIFTHEQ